MLLTPPQIAAGPHLTLSRRVVGCAVSVFPVALQKRLIMRARLAGLLCFTDADSMLAERGLKEK